MKLSSLALTFPVLVLLSCAAPKAEVIEQTPAPKKEVVKETPKAPEPEAVPEQIATLGQPNDGIRLPDMVTMPDDTEFRATTPGTTVSKPEGSGVIAKPPSEPPAQPKDGQ